MADSHSIVKPEISGGVSGIYKIRFLDQIYIGSSADMLYRWYGHLRDLRAGKHHSRYLQNRFNKHATETVEFSIVEIVPLAEYLLVREQHYLDTLKPAYNTTPTAGSCRGLKRSDEVRRRMSEARKGRRVISDEAYARSAAKRTGQKQSAETSARKSIAIRAAIAKRPGWGKWNAGKPKPREAVEKMRAALTGARRPKRSAETRLKQSIALRGKKRTPEQCARIAAGQRGLKRAPRSEEARRNLSIALTGRIFSPEHCANISRAKKGKPRGLRKAA